MLEHPIEALSWMLHSLYPFNRPLVAQKQLGAVKTYALQNLTNVLHHSAMVDRLRQVYMPEVTRTLFRSTSASETYPISLNCSKPRIVDATIGRKVRELIVDPLVVDLAHTLLEHLVWVEDAKLYRNRLL